MLGIHFPLRRERDCRTLIKNEGKTFTEWEPRIREAKREFLQYKISTGIYIFYSITNKAALIIIFSIILLGLT